MFFSASFIAFAFFVQSALAAPVGESAPQHLALDKRAKCLDGFDSPCICNGEFGIRKKSLRCPSDAFAFASKSSTTDGKVVYKSSNFGLNVQCDHIVELQFIAEEIAANPNICAKFRASSSALDSFFKTINNDPNLIFVESSVNGAKGVLFGGKSFATGTNRKAASGVASYLNQLRPDAKKAADTIFAKMESIMGRGRGFASDFTDAYLDEMKSLAAKAARDAPRLPAAPQSGGGFQIIDETDSTIRRCRRSWWLEARDFVVRQVTGKAPAKTAASGEACTLEPKKPATDAKKTTTAAKKPATAAKKTTAAKKPATAAKKTTAKKAAVKKTTAKTAAKKTALKKTTKKN